MYIPAETLDDLLRKVFDRLLSSKNRIAPTKGPATELFGVLLKISNPRTRLSRTETKGTLFSCLGELLWYLSGTHELAFISYYLPGYDKYSDDGITVHGGYGPRLFGTRSNPPQLFDNRNSNQVRNVIELLRKKPDSRQAVIQLFDAADILQEHRDIPCTCTLQFTIRNRQLHMLTNMRSNDAFRGLPHDVFAFTMLQEIIARTLDVELGQYKHAVGSLHLYDEDRAGAYQYLDEDWQSKVPMPAMPLGDPWPSVRALLDAEFRVRNNGVINFKELRIPKYWVDLALILQIFRYTNGESSARKVAALVKRLSSNVYAPYIAKRLAKKLSKGTPNQLEFFP